MNKIMKIQRHRFRLSRLTTVMLPLLLIAPCSLLATQNSLSNHIIQSNLNTAFPTGDSWLTAGGGLLNTNFQPDGWLIDSSNITQLQMQWSLSTQGGLPASSTIDNHSLYVSSSNGTLNKIDTQTGSLL